MNGHIISGTSICVDYWLWTPEKKYYHFLTHLHADHTVNLKSTFREKIYTSPFNAWLVRRWFNISPECVVPLTVGDSHLLYDPHSQTRFSVTLLDANHCPGSVMFLFQGEFGNILYTGDFRYNPKMVKHPMLRSLIENEAVNRLYLDNTFAAEHCEFPPREEALKKVISVVKDHPDHNIVVGVRKLGKEEVLRSIALELKEKICVSEEKLKILTKLGYESVFTTDPEDSRIFVKEIPHITLRSIDQFRAERGPVVTILLTALYSVIPPTAKYTAKQEKGMYKIPYSDHSCHSELVEFVSKIKPKEIFPIVNSSANMKTNSLKTGDGSEILSCSWQNNVMPKSITKFCKNAKNWESMPNITVPKNTFINGLNQDVVSYMTEDSDTGCEGFMGMTGSIQVSKNQMREESGAQMSSSENETRTENETAEIILKGFPVVCSFQRENQTTSSSQKTMSPCYKTTVTYQEASEEYFTMSDENLSQLHVTSYQPNISTANLTSKEVVSGREMAMINDQAECERSEVSHVNNFSGLSNGCQSIDNQVNTVKSARFVPPTPPATTEEPVIYKKSPPTPGIIEIQYLDNSGNNFHLRTKHISHGIPCFNDSEQVITNKKFSKDESHLEEKIISRSMPKTPNRSTNSKKNHIVENTSHFSEFEASQKAKIQFDEDEKRFDEDEKRFDEDEKRFDEDEKRFDEDEKRFDEDEKRFDEDEKRIRQIRAAILKRIFKPILEPVVVPSAKQNMVNNGLKSTSGFVTNNQYGTNSIPLAPFYDEERNFTPQLPVAKHFKKDLSQNNSCSQNLHSSTNNFIGNKSKPLIKLQFDQFKKRKDDIKTSAVSPRHHSHLPPRKINMAQTNGFVKNSNASQMNHEERNLDECGSDSTTSDLEDNCLTLELFEVLDRRNDQIRKTGKRSISTTRNIRISDKFGHLLVKERFPNKCKSSGFFSPESVPKTPQKFKCETNRHRSNLCKKSTESESPLIEASNILQEEKSACERIAKSNDRRNSLKRLKCSNQSKQKVQFKKPSNECEGFYDFVFARKIYTSWKEAVEKVNNK